MVLVVEDAGVGKTRFAGEAMGRGLDPAAARLSARLTPLSVRARQP